MNSDNTSQIFGSYTRYYDLLYSNKNYSLETDYITSFIKKNRPGSLNILDVGCGTGIHAIELINRGYRVQGIDLSTGMLDRARRRANKLPQELACRINFSEGDARNFHSEHSFDVVISLFHVMSYQTENKDISAAFITAASNLKQGGLFIFDFWFGPGVLTDPPVVRVLRLENEEIKVLRIAEPILDVNRNIVSVGYEIHILDKIKKENEIIKEKHQMRYFFLPELEMLLKNAGFTQIESLEWMSMQNPTKKTWNAIVCCVKK